MTAQRWAVLGSAGMLGQEFMAANLQHEVVGFTRQEIDITDIDSLRDQLCNFDVVVNCAGWTAVDDAETQEHDAFLVNADGVRNVAQVCSEIEAQLVHISTDYVFDGSATSPYSEDAPTNPKSAYGRTKLAGEIAVQEVLPNNHYIVRTAWLYGQYGPNFVKTMLQLETSKETLSVVDDQVGQPTWTKDLVQQIALMIDSKVPSGIYHGTSSSQTSWFEFTQEIFRLIGADPARVLPTTTDNFPRPAPRPAYSVLGHGKWLENGMQPIRNWKEAISEAISAVAK